MFSKGKNNEGLFFHELGEMGSLRTAKRLL